MDLRLTSVLLKSVFCSGPHIHGSFFFNSFLSRSICSKSFGRNFAIYCIAPRNDFRSFVFSGGFNLSLASTFSSFGFIPFSFISCPSHFVSFKKNSDFFLLARNPAFSNLSRTLNSFFSWSCLLPRVTMIMSSNHAGVQYSSVRSIFSWKIVGMSARP